ncbi:hypothetical protein ACTFIV_002023 [Dictyostelium citrinum]
MSSYPVDIDNHDEDPIILNVGGVKYEVMPSTLAQYPETLLGNIFHPNNRHLRKPDKKGEYFFDRNGASFDVILNYYRTGKIVIPPNVSEEIIREELRYFKIDYKGNLGGSGNSSFKSKEEDEDDKIMKQPKDQVYDYAQGLIHSTNRADIKRGLKFIGKLREMEPNSYLYRYSYSFACYRLGENVKGIQTLQEILATDQHNPQAKSLLTLFNDVRLSNTRNGIVMCCLAVIGIYGFIKVRKWYQLAKFLNNVSIPTSAVDTASSAIKSVGSSVIGASGNIGTSSVVGPLSSSIPHTIVSNIPTEKIINHVVEKVVTDSAKSVANNTLNTISEASINSLSQSNVQSIPIDQFNNLVSNTFSR